MAGTTLIPVIALLLDLGGGTVTPTAGPVKVRYDVPRDAKLSGYLELLKSNYLLETVAGTVNRQFRLPNDLTLVAAQCGAAVPPYDREGRRVTICYEDVARFSPLPADEEAVIGAAGFTLYHGLGHALMDVLALEVPGKPEEAADQLGTLLLLQQFDADVAGVAIDGGLETANEHSLDEQRLDNVACWVHGSDPVAFAALGQGGALPADRVAGCAEEWRKASTLWSRLLAPHRVEPEKRDLTQPVVGGLVNPR